MSHAADFWYIRFPDGRILRAASTTILRNELGAGRIPLNSTVRRSPSEEWMSLEWTQEFADLVEQQQAARAEAAARRAAAPIPEPAAAAPAVSPTTVAARLDPSRLHLVGIRGYAQELVAALDSTLVFSKLVVTAVAGLLLGMALAIGTSPALGPGGLPAEVAWCLSGVVLLVLAFTAGLVTRLTYVELSRLRPARWREGLAGIGLLTVRLVVGLGLVGGGAWGLIVLLRWLPWWLWPADGADGSAGREAVAAAALCLGMLLEVCLWPVFPLACLLPPILVVERCSVWRGLADWLTLLRNHLGPVLLYEAMAVGLGVLASAPFVLLLIPLSGWYVDEPLRLLAGWTRAVLLGLAAAPLLAYLIVANVFIYLNLRYAATSQ